MGEYSNIKRDTIENLFLNMTALCLFVATSMVSIILISSNPMVDAIDLIDRYWVVLTGRQQIPPVDTDALAFVGLKFSEDTTKLVYNVNVGNIDNVTGVYLYHKNVGHNDTLVFDFLKDTRKSNRESERALDTSKEGETTGTLKIGTITKTDLRGDLHGKTMSDLYRMMANGSLYITITTKDFPRGEIRGNSFVILDDVFHGAEQFRWEN
jgi:CHRD domain-containing protein